MLDRSGNIERGRARLMALSLAAILGAAAVAACVDTGTRAPRVGSGHGGQEISIPAVKPFVHPGLLHTEKDFERMRAKVAEGAHPWIEGWQMLVKNHHASLDWKPNPQQ